jgi:cyclopropane fatty-acyl-phospholipid synthase-like methyltransferase
MIDLSNCKTLLDVGGGPGTYSVLLAQANPELNCTVIDLPAVAEVADELIQQQNMAERVRTIHGSYHDTEFPQNQDAIIFFGVLHQESPEDIKRLFKKAHNALNPGGKIYVLDMMTDHTHTKPAFSALFAVNMALTTANGWVFSDAELRDWLEYAGFSGFSCAPLPPPMPHWLASASK